MVNHYLGFFFLIFYLFIREKNLPNNPSQPKFTLKISRLSMMQLKSTIITHSNRLTTIIVGARSQII
jgi:hypothetical protein